MLRFENVTLAYGDREAVSDLTFSIEPGEIFGLLGPNGAGKSSTIHMAVGLLRPKAGKVEIRGFGSPMEPSVRARIGIAPQSLSLYDELTGEENLRFFGEIHGIARSEIASRTEELLELAGLRDRRKDRVASYSGGMKRRLNIAVALVGKPPLLLLDEPTVGVDPQSRNAIFDAIRRLRDEGLTLLYTTHYMEEAQRLCDRVGVLDRGRLLALDRVDALIDRHGGKSVVRVEAESGERRIDTDNPMRELPAILEEPDVLGIKIERPDLETVFLNLTGRSLRD